MPTDEAAIAKYLLEVDFIVMQGYVLAYSRANFKNWIRFKFFNSYKQKLTQAVNIFTELDNLYTKLKAKLKPENQAMVLFPPISNCDSSNLLLQIEYQ